MSERTRYPLYDLPSGEVAEMTPDGAIVWPNEAARLADVPNVDDDYEHTSGSLSGEPAAVLAEMPGATLRGRTYVVGLPVIITVATDGSVSYEIDTSEAGAAAAEVFHDGYMIDPPTEAEMLADVALIDAHHDATRPAAWCRECRQDLAVAWGMCDGCIHDARRSGWNPPND